MMSVTDAHAAAGTPLDSRPVSRSSVGHLSVRSQADTEGGRGSGTPQPGAQFFPSSLNFWEAGSQHMCWAWILCILCVRDTVVQTLWVG